MKGTTAEKEKLERIKQGMPGSPCSEEYLVSNTEFGKEPICTASHKYQKQKIEQLQSLNLSKEDHDRQLQNVLDKECLCVGLSNAAVKTYDLKPFSKRRKAINICPGPNIAYFSEIVSLKKMVDHIYGRTNILQSDGRPHMFIKELSLYVDYWNEMLSELKGTVDNKRRTYIESFYGNLEQGISYYRQLTTTMNEEFSGLKNKIESGLDEVESQLKNMFDRYQVNSLSEA